MVSTYTPKLNLEKPAQGDVGWHIPNNNNWDIIDSELGTLTENIEVGETEITINKKVVVNEIVSPKVLLDPYSSPSTKREECISSSTGTVKTFTIPSQYIEGSALKMEGTLSLTLLTQYYVGCQLDIKVNDSVVKSYLLSCDDEHGYSSISFEEYISVKGNDIVTIVITISLDPSYPSLYSVSCNVAFYGNDALPFIISHPSWS